MVEMIKPEHWFIVVEPEIMFGEGDQNPIMRFQLCEEKQPGLFGRNGKYIHLELPNAAAMQLLGSLRGYQKHMGLPDPETPQAIETGQKGNLN
jgi:hypothetical protein